MVRTFGITHLKDREIRDYVKHQPMYIHQDITVNFYSSNSVLALRTRRRVSFSNKSDFRFQQCQ